MSMRTVGTSEKIGAQCRCRGLSSNWTENRVKPGRDSHFFLPYRIFPPSTTFSPSLRSVPSGATCRYAVNEEYKARLSPLIHEHINTQGRHSFVMPEAVVKGELRPLRNPADDLD